MINFREPNRKAPRFTSPKLNILDFTFYKNIIKVYPVLKKYSQKDINSIIKLCNEAIWKKVIDNRDGVELPEFLGYIFIGSCEQSKKDNIDYASSIKYNQKILHKNFETDGYVAKIFYTNSEIKYKFKYNNLWKFTACRNFINKVSDTYPKQWSKYVKVPKYKHIGIFFKKERNYVNKINKTKNFLEEYDEFEGL